MLVFDQVWRLYLPLTTISLCARYGTPNIRLIMVYACHTIRLVYACHTTIRKGKLSLKFLEILKRFSCFLYYRNSVACSRRHFYWMHLLSFLSDLISLINRREINILFPCEKRLFAPWHIRVEQTGVSCVYRIVKLLI